MRDAALGATALLSLVAAVAGDLQTGVVLAALAYGVAAWQNHRSVAAVGALHTLAAAAAPTAVRILLEAAPSALAVLPLKENPLAVPLAAAVAFAVGAAMRFLSAVRDVLPLVESWPYVVVALAALVIAVARRL